MNDLELNRLLKSAQAPVRPDEYWKKFPARVTARIREQKLHPETVQPKGQSFEATGWAWWAALKLRPAFAIGVAGIVVGLAFLAGVWHGKHHNSDPSMAEVQKYLREIQALFPYQLQAIVFDESGPQLLLADAANVPSSAPLYLKICGPKGCRHIVTFSGQQIRINGEVCDVLVDHRGEVMVVGQKFLWCSSGSAHSTGRYRIEAKALDQPS